MLLDLPTFSLSFQDSASPIAEGIVDLHHGIFFYLIGILVPVLYMFYKIVLIGHFSWSNPNKKTMLKIQKNYLILNNIVHGTILEIVWTLVPSIILMLIAIPSFALLYSVDEIIDPRFTIKVIGHQWYWSYESPDSDLDSYMSPAADAKTGDLRLLETDNCLMCPINTHLRFIITSLDVLHSFSLPSFGIKIDAVPGRLNQVSTLINREGLYLGQCSELCGANHGFMPIKIIAIDADLI